MRNTVKFGTLMIVLLVTALCSLILMLLAFSTAAMDRRMTGRYALSVTEEYKFETYGQEWLAKADSALAKDPGADLTAVGAPSDLKSDFSVKESSEGKYDVCIGSVNGRHLSIRIVVDGSGRYTVTEWALTPRQLEKQAITDLYKGK